MASPIQVLINDVQRLRNLAQSYRDSSTTHSYSVPDVLDIAASLINTVIKSKEVENMEKSQEKKQKEIDEILNSKEQIFIQKMENQVNHVAEKMEAMSDKYIHVQQELQSILDRISLVHDKALQLERDKKEEEIREYEKEWDKERSDLLEQERQIYQSIEKNTTEALTKIADSYKEKLQKADDEITQTQTKLNVLIHDKHQQGKVKQKALEEEERRMAQEHERITTEYNTKKAEVEKETFELNNKIADLKKQIASESQDSQDRLRRLEQSMVEEHNKQIDMKNEEIERKNQRIKILENTLLDKQEELADAKQSLDKKIHEVETYYGVKIDIETKLVRDVIAQIKEALEIEYRKKYGELTDIISEEEIKRGQNFDSMRQDQQKLTEKLRAEEQKVETVYTREITNLTRKRDEAKERLRETRSQKLHDLTELKHSRERDVGREMQKFDDQMADEANQINTLLKQFDLKQKELNELHQMSVEKRNKKKADELKKLKRLHEERKQQIFIDIEKQIKEDTEREIEAKLKEARGNQPLTRTSLELRGKGLKSRMANLNLRMEDLIQENQQLVADISEFSQNPHAKLKLSAKSRSASTSLSDLKSLDQKVIAPKAQNIYTSGSTINFGYSISNETIQEVNETPSFSETIYEDDEAGQSSDEFGEVKKISKMAPVQQQETQPQTQQLFQKLRESLAETERRKAIVVQEAKILDEDIEKLHQTFSNRILQIEHRFAASKISILDKKEMLGYRQNIMERSLMNQEREMDRLQNKVDIKTKEAETLEQKIGQQTEEYKIALQKEQEEQLQEAKAGGEDIQVQMNEIKEDFQERIKELQDKLTVSKAATEKITQYMLRVREQKLEEAEAEIRFTMEERHNIRKEQHDKRMKTMNQEFDEMKKTYLGNLKAARENFDKEVTKAKEDYSVHYDELTSEKQNLIQEDKELDEEIEDLSTKECRGCVEKKQILKNLLQKREMIQRHIGSMRDIQQGLEVKMNSIFRDETKKGYSPRVMSPVVIAPRAKTAMAKLRP